MAPVAKGDEDRGWPLLKFLHGFYLPMQQIDDIVRDREDMPGWAILFDPDLCPARYLPWLAMFAGVRLLPGMTEAEIRSRIKARDGIKRCTPAALLAAAKDYASPGATVVLRERYNPYEPTEDAAGYVTLIAFADETPDPFALFNAVKAEQKDVGLLLYLVVSAHTDYFAVEADNESYQDVIDNYATYDALLAAHEQDYTALLGSGTYDGLAGEFDSYDNMERDWLPGQIIGP